MNSILSDTIIVKIEMNKMPYIVRTCVTRAVHRFDSQAKIFFHEFWILDSGQLGSALIVFMCI